MKKRVLGLLLVLSLLIGMLPMTILSANAASTSIEVDTWDALESALKSSERTSIKVTKDIKHKHEKYSDGHVTTVINGTKNLDLNGHTVKCEDNSNIQHYMYGGHDCIEWIKNPKPMFKVAEGAMVTIEDTAGNGYIRFEGAIMGNTAGPNENQNIQAHTVRDIFSVFGTLIVSGGTIEAGRVERQWIVNGKDGTDATFSDDYSHFDGYCRQQIWGNAVNVQTGGTLVVNGGVLQGRGQTTVHLMDGYTSDGDWICSQDDGRRASVVAIAEGAKVYINGGSLLGKGGACVFSGMKQAPTPEGTLQIRGGTFATDKHDKVRATDSHDRWNLGSFYPVVFTGTYGSLGIPKDAYASVADKLAMVVNDKVYIGNNEIAFLDLNRTGTWYDIAYTHGSYATGFEKHDGQKMSVTVAGTPVYEEPLYLDGGMYTDYALTDNQTVRWNYNSQEHLTVSAKYYDAYFTDTTGTGEQKTDYIWTFTSATDSIDFFEMTNDGKIDITEALKKRGYISPQGVLTVSCEIVERITYSGTPCEHRSHTYTFQINPTKTPLDASLLPGGGMKVTVTYPNYSGLGSDIVISVQPTPEQLAQAQYGSSYPVYYYSYRDNDANYEDEPWRSYKSTHTSNWMDWGHNQVSVLMYIHGADGVSAHYEEQAWALKLPDITPAGGTWNTDKTVFMGTPGTKVTLKAPIDTTNAQVAADKIVASDILGWYKITYNTLGELAYTPVGATQTATCNITENGTYLYAAKDRNRNTVYSKPVQVQFVADIYNISIAKSDDTNFVVYADGTYANDTVLTATVGTSVTRTMVRWKVVNYPYGAEKYVNSSAIINSKTSLTKNVSDFFSKSKLDEIVPGYYIIQAFVEKDGVVLGTSNHLVITVNRVADGVDIFADHGKPVNGKTIEGPYVGNTMQLKCAPANGADSPQYAKGISWGIETLVGSNVATIDANGVLTARNPGRVKVTAKAGYTSGNTILYHTQTVIINIPITEFAVTLGTPSIGTSGDTIVSVPANAPYELSVYWDGGVNTKDVFLANGLPSANISLVAKEGYVLPMRQIFLSTNGDDTWFTYADDCYVTVNGTRYSFPSLPGYWTDGYTASGQYGDFQGSSRPKTSVTFEHTWERLRDPSSTYLDYVNLTAPIPEVGHTRDMAPEDAYTSMLPTCTNNSSIFTWVNSGGIYKVSGDSLGDSDETNDNAVTMGETETFQKGQMYRADIYFNTNAKNDGTFFAENVTLMVNGQKCHIETLQGSANLDGQSLAVAYYYFMPTAKRNTISNLIIKDLYAPEGYMQPASADDITEFSSDFSIGEEVYVSRIAWFLDTNNNNRLDSGEDSAEYFNANGTFISGLRYSVYLQLEVRDRNGDGRGDYVEFADNANIKIGSMGNVPMSGNQNGAVYKFPAAPVPEYGVTTNPDKLVFNLPEGYSSPEMQVTCTSVGKSKVNSVIASAKDNDLLDVSCNGMTVSVSLASGLPAGSYSTIVYIQNEYGQVYYQLPVIIHVGQPVSDVLRGDLNDDGSVNNLDVEYLLWHTLFPDDYALNQDGNFDGEGNVNNKDVEYLLWHTLFPDDYPL